MSLSALTIQDVLSAAGLTTLLNSFPLNESSPVPRFAFSVVWMQSVSADSPEVTPGGHALFAEPFRVTVRSDVRAP